MEKLALLFSGQGAQHVGMGRELYDNSPASREIFDQADQILGVGLKQVCFEGPELELTQTSWCQPAIFTHSLAALAAVRAAQPNLVFQAAAGLSLGELTALTAAGWLTFQDGLRLVRRRGELMQQACESSEGTMASILGMEAEPLRAVCEECGVDLANLNGPGNIVISGNKPGVEKAIALAKERGAKRALPLMVAGAYHSRLMKSAAVAFEASLATTTFQASSISVISNVSALPHDPSEVKKGLVDQVTSSVRWDDSMRGLISQGFRKFIELGPGEVLAGLMNRIDREVQIISISKTTDLEKLSTLLP